MRRTAAPMSSVLLVLPRFYLRGSHRAKQAAQQHALERRLLVDAVMVGVAEEGVADLRISRPGVGVRGARQVRAEHARARDPAVTAVEHRLRFLAVHGLEPRESLDLRHERAGER